MTDDRQALEEIEHRIVDAIRTRDVEVLRALMTEDFVHAGPGQPSQAFDEFARAIAGADYVIERLAARDMSARVFGDTALLTGVQDARVRLPDGTVVEASSAFADVFTRAGDGWRVRHAWTVDLPSAG